MNKNRTSDKGNLSESKVLTSYIQAGFAVSVPFGGSAPYDLIVDTGNRLLKVQVKTGRLRNGCILFPMQRFSGHNAKAQDYKIGEIDLFAVYCPDNEKIYVIKFCGDLTQCRLRCFETKNNQRHNIRWAIDYEFAKHVEELRREVELRGIEPMTS